MYFGDLTGGLRVIALLIAAAGYVIGRTIEWMVM